MSHASAPTAEAALFVTAFYGVLDPETGHMSYGNAGHNPPFVFKNRDPIIIQELIRTGMPIGVEEEMTWKTAFVQLRPGDRLLLYTDGIPEARNAAGELFTTRPMLAVAKENLGASAEELQSKILKRVAEFVGDAPQSDDITLMVLARNPVS